MYDSQLKKNWIRPVLCTFQAGGPDAVAGAGRGLVVVVVDEEEAGLELFAVVRGNRTLGGSMQDVVGPWINVILVICCLKRRISVLSIFIISNKLAGSVRFDHI